MKRKSNMQNSFNLGLSKQIYFEGASKKLPSHIHISALVKHVKSRHCHFVKSVRIRSYSGPHFPVFGLNTDRYSVSLRIQSKYGKMRTRITLNTDTFYAVRAMYATYTLSFCQIWTLVQFFSFIFLMCY